MLFTSPKPNPNLTLKVILFVSKTHIRATHPESTKLNAPHLPFGQPTTGQVQ